jgi:hypothetical protein
MKKNLLILAILMFTGFVHAQKEEAINKYWVTLGGWFENRNFTGNVAYNFSIGNYFYKVGYLLKGDDPVLGGYGSDNIKIRSIDASIGRRVLSNWFQTSFFVGPSYVFGTKLMGNSSSESFHTVGLESEIQLLFRPANEVGIGIGLYGNLNFERNYAGINVNLTLGNGK